MNAFEFLQVKYQKFPCLKVLGAIHNMYAEVVTFVAGSLEAGGLPGSLEVPLVLK